MRTVITALALIAFSFSAILAQPPGGGGSRGGDGGSRGGFGGGPGGGFPGGGFPGGGFPGGTRGGAPGGGFPGGSRGGPPGGGFPGGGAPGGSRGGAPGGSRGGDTGGRGGFNPADMLARFDRNGNKMIDPDEAEGPAQFFLQRLAQNNPKIDLKKPVPLELLSAEMDRMRGGGDSSSDNSSASNEPELLVPDFSLDYEPEPIAGFGAASSLFNVKVEERDQKDAEERMRRYDQNRDGSLSAEELRSGRWSDDPMQYDRNRDGKLSKSELAVRAANRRTADEERRNPSNNDPRSRFAGGRGGDNGWMRSDGNNEEPKEAVDRFGDAKSYRIGSGGSVSGLPDFFARSDANGDGQVLMNEFSSSWSQETLDEFLKWDLNRDGIIIAQECLSALENGARVSGATASTPAASATSSSGGASIGGSELDWAKRQIGKYDANSDGQLTANEWEKMIIKPTGADENGDGVITAEEYAAFRAKK